MSNIQAYSLKELKEKYDDTTIHYMLYDFRCERDESIETFVKNDKGGTRLKHFIMVLEV